VTARGDWYISAKAVWDYVRIQRWPETEESFAKAEDALLDISCKGEARFALAQDNGLLQYKTGRKHHRIRLLVSTKERAEGDKRQVVAVLPAFHKTT
jgi:hypothetical protein